jgi:hypothetical protein
MHIAVDRTGNKIVSTNEAQVSVSCVIMQSIKRAPAESHMSICGDRSKYMDISRASSSEIPAMQFHATAIKLQGRPSVLL